MKPIWIVDDDPSIRFVLEKALAREQLPTRSFVHPKEVLEAFDNVSDQAQGPSVLVSDIRMPGGNGLQLTLSHAAEIHDDSAIGHDVMALHQALDQLAEVDQRAASVVELTYFGGISRDEIALVLSVSAPTVDRDLRFARAWLNRQLG